MQEANILIKDRKNVFLLSEKRLQDQAHLDHDWWVLGT